ncbi:sigma-70 family RNA polymerase sigma factor [Nocardioides sp. YIM 152315]|uniref:sigma-70 family RNA polymerase sigma factor n=1 Tax=Nocardioides sp. YIM 152315 TaxID=3031760 RepID=UPI0023DC3A74|nr:sigma-70 family RNA polymerase sigma factor [Nocardioides sp. YIM 152315]MDF1604700.1 sigma-70 family RNA polymerase sigma factor [Nocardioides sp. YIM 152315]
MVEEISSLEAFERERPRLRALAYRMLGSGADADDAVQDAWLRLDSAGAANIENLPGWLTTAVSRICLNLLRSRRVRREESLESFTADWLGAVDEDRLPQQEADLADSVGLALLIVLDRLSPAERIAFVLHDMFDVAFDDIASMMDRSPAAARQLASRARAKVRAGGSPVPDRAQHRDAVSAYLTATRTGDFNALLALLDPQVELRADAAVTGTGRPLTLQGALTVARTALSAAPRARFTTVALVDRSPALLMAPLGQVCLAIRFTFAGDAIIAIDITADPARLRALDITLD